MCRKASVDGVARTRISTYLSPESAFLPTNTSFIIYYLGIIVFSLIWHSRFRYDRFWWPGAAGESNRNLFFVYVDGVDLPDNHQQKQSHVSVQPA